MASAITSAYKGGGISEHFPYGLMSLGAVLVPRIALVTLSVGFCLAVVLRYARAIQDKEVVVLSGCGRPLGFFCVRP